MVKEGEARDEELFVCMKGLIGGEMGDKIRDSKSMRSFQKGREEVK
jgi:hypothetical protein